MSLKRREAGPEVLRIMMSIRPEWTEKIFAGGEVIEVRRTAPHIESERQLPIRVYVYETKGTKAKPGAGAVIGELSCPWVCRTNVERLRRYPMLYPQRYAEPVPLAAFNLKRAPQSWMKLKPWGVRK